MMSYAVYIPVLTGSADSPVDLNETAVRLVLLSSNREFAIQSITIQ